MAAADAAEVFYVQASSTPVHFEANAIKGVDANDAAAAAVRVIKDGRVGFSSTSNLDDLQALVDAAIETAPFGAQARFDFPGVQDYSNVPVFDQSVNDVTLEEMVSLGEKIVSDIRRDSTDVQVEGSVSKSTSSLTLANSSGGGFSYDRSRFGVGFEGTVIRGEDMLFTFDGESSVSALTDSSSVVASILRQLSWASNTAVVGTGTMPVILMPTAVSSVLLSPLMAGLNGKSVLQGTSPLAGKIGEKIVDDRFTLIDDATLPWVPGSRPSDDEGVASRRLPLIDRGLVKTFFYDLQTAGQAGTNSTGSGARGMGSLPGPSAGVLLIQEGTVGLEDLIAGVKEGLIVERLLGAGQSNVLGGDFNANVLLGYKIENGRVVGRVKNTMISGNAYKALNNVIEIGCDGRWLGGGLFTPAIAIDGVSVSSQA